ncbi:hypothetical protein AWW66_14385 [Micromonospora rosaria]|uniref:Uncharacterized protein n=1 Tax=Micromonospora rosaria TaxID=47874 RepID=A0A136PSB2_9ACTN|nr:hypothetical protein [Micromonospora rosaria]KXK61322.1 hypothetical protein AWW66_14385 [Micromonospora rosaria]
MRRNRRGSGSAYDDEPRHRPLLDLTALVVLALAGGAGWLAYREGGWPVALTVGFAVAAGLHRLLRGG